MEPAVNIEGGAGTAEVGAEVVGEISPAVTEAAAQATAQPQAVEVASMAVATHNYSVLFIGLGVVVFVAFLVWYFTQDRDAGAGT